MVRAWKADVRHPRRPPPRRPGCLLVAAPEGAQQSLVAARPDAYFRPPYVGARGWVGVYLDIDDVDWDMVADIVEDAYRTIAPETLVARLDPAE